SIVGSARRSKPALELGVSELGVVTALAMARAWSVIPSFPFCLPGRPSRVLYSDDHCEAAGGFIFGPQYWLPHSRQVRDPRNYRHRTHWGMSSLDCFLWSATGR